jgi:Ca-activated chloride channel family protein
MLIRDSKLKGATSYPQVIELARHATGDDAQGYRAGFVQLVRKAEVIAQLSGKTGPRLAR